MYNIYGKSCEISKSIKVFFFFPHGVTIKEVGNNLFVAIFVSEKDMVEVLDRSPWSFNKRLILLKRFNGDLNPGNASLQYSIFWIQVFNIPIKSMNKYVGTRLLMRLGSCFWLMP